MKTKMTTPSAPVVLTDHQTDSTKLVSLLALAAGAVAMPQTGNADIIYDDRSSNPVVVGYGGAPSFDFVLPGTALFRFQRSETSGTFTSIFPVTVRYAIAGNRGLGGAPVGVRGDAVGFAVPLPAGAAWGQGNPGDATWNFVTVGKASNYGQTPSGGYDHQYLAWVFADSTQGNADRYGWVEVSLSINHVTGPGSGPNVTIWGYAYDNTGAKPDMGQVPEPTSMSLLALGALALGARGVRSWRRDRDAASKS